MVLTTAALHLPGLNLLPSLPHLPGLYVSTSPHLPGLHLPQSLPHPTGLYLSPSPSIYLAYLPPSLPSTYLASTCFYQFPLSTWLLAVSTSPRHLPASLRHIFLSSMYNFTFLQIDSCPRLPVPIFRPFPFANSGIIQTLYYGTPFHSPAWLAVVQLLRFFLFFHQL